MPCIPELYLDGNRKNCTYFQKVLDNLTNFLYPIVVSVGLKPQPCGGDDEFHRTERLAEHANYRQQTLENFVPMVSDLFDGLGSKAFTDSRGKLFRASDQSI